MKTFTLCLTMFVTIVCRIFAGSEALDKALEVHSSEEVYLLFKSEMDALDSDEYPDFEAALRIVIFSLSGDEMKKLPDYRFEEVLPKAINGRSPREVILLGACVNLGFARFAEEKTVSDPDRSLFFNMRQQAIIWINRYSKKDGVR